MGKMNVDFLKKAAGVVFAFGKKNKTTLMTGGGVALGWAGVYLFWRECLKAEEEIREAEKAVVDENGNEVQPAKKLDMREKVFIYAEHCWPSAVVGVVSSGLTLYSHKLDLDDIAKGYIATQFFKEKSEEQGRLIEKMKAEVPDKKLKGIEREMATEDYDRAMNNGIPIEETGNGNTLFIVDKGLFKFRSSVESVSKGLYEFKDLLRDRYNSVVKRKLGDAFYASDHPYPDNDVFASEDYDVFLRMIGMKHPPDLGDLLEIRDYGDKDFLPVNAVMDYTNFVDPDTGVPTVCWIRISDYLSPTYELLERNP